jgi:predicted enzyme related to lactoylglutathione lyase
MSERDGFQPGVPCWVDTWQPDAAAAVAFYTELFGWEAENTMPPGSPGQHFMCRLRGRDVAAVGSKPEASPAPGPAWGTYVWVDSADDAVTKAIDAGGGVVMKPFDSLDSGRMAVISDPAGAVIGIWQPGVHTGAQLVNEPGAWAMSLLNTREPAGATAFYGAVFGWNVEAFDMGGSQIALWRLPGYEGGQPEQPVPRDVVGVMVPSDQGPAHWSVDFRVHDADAAAAKAAELGGSVVVPPYDTPGFRQAVLADPHGAVFSVSQLTAAG